MIIKGLRPGVRPQGTAAEWRERAEWFRALLERAGGRDLTARHTDGTVIPHVIQASIELCLRLAAAAEASEPRH